MLNRVKRILDNWLNNDPDGYVELEPLDSGRISGYVVSHHFDDLDQVDRQKSLRQVLKDALGPDVQEVSIILTYTPHEMRVMQAA